MSIVTYKFSTHGDIFSDDGKEILVGDNGQLALEVRADDSSLFFGSGIPVGNGVFLTVSHIFDEVLHTKDGKKVRFEASWAEIDGNYTQTPVNLRRYNAITADYIYSYGIHDAAVNDLAYVKTRYNVPASSFNSLTVFVDRTALNDFLRPQTITRYGEVTDQLRFLRGNLCGGGILRKYRGCTRR